jgi:hypothetical protein
MLWNRYLPIYEWGYGIRSIVSSKSEKPSIARYASSNSIALRDRVRTSLVCMALRAHVRTTVFCENLALRGSHKK